MDSVLHEWAAAIYDEIQCCGGEFVDLEGKVISGFPWREGDAPSTLVASFTELGETYTVVISHHAKKTETQSTVDNHTGLSDEEIASVIGVTEQLDRESNPAPSDLPFDKGLDRHDDYE